MPFTTLREENKEGGIVMEEIMLVLAIALLGEGLTQYIKEIVIDKEMRKAHILSIVVGVALAFVFNGQLFEALDMTTIHPALDVALTGVVISRGSNHVYELIQKMTGKDLSNLPSAIGDDY